MFFAIVATFQKSQYFVTQVQVRRNEQIKISLVYQMANKMPSGIYFVYYINIRKTEK